MKKLFKKIFGPSIRNKELKQAIAQDPNEYVAAWCRQLICESIMNNKKRFFEKDYQDIENKRELFVIALKILNRKLNNRWGIGYVKGFLNAFMETDFYNALTIYDRNKKGDVVLEWDWRNQLEKSLIPELDLSPLKKFEIFGLHLNLNLSEYKKPKYKEFIKGYNAAIEDMRSFTCENGGKRPYIETKNLYEFLIKK